MSDQLQAQFSPENLILKIAIPSINTTTKTKMKGRILLPLERRQKEERLKLFKLIILFSSLNKISC
jgi:hypothetical protein